jgi:hypothetical protein
MCKLAKRADRNRIDRSLERTRRAALANRASVGVFAEKRDQLYSAIQPFDFGQDFFLLLSRGSGQLQQNLAQAIERKKDSSQLIYHRHNRSPRFSNLITSPPMRATVNEKQSDPGEN